MGEINIWIILGVLAFILLIVSWRKKSAIWGGFTIGIIMGFLVALFFAAKGNGFDWFIIPKGAIAGTMLGFIMEIIGKISDFLRGGHGR